MNRFKPNSLAALTALGLLLAVDAGAKEPAAKTAPTMPAPQITIEPKAVDLLKAMSSRLAAAKTMSFQTVSTYESPSLIGPPLAYTTISDVTLQRPDKLKVITPGDGPASEFYYDGKTMTAFAPAENLVAIAPAPPTIDAALAAAYSDASIYFPFSDAIVADPYKDMSEGMRTAFVVGQSKVVGGVTTDIVALTNDRIFVQIWIGADDKLPREIRAVYKDDPSSLRHQVEFSNWKLDGSAAAGDFASSRAAAANKIPFASPDLKLPDEAAPKKADASAKK